MDPIKIGYIKHEYGVNIEQDYPTIRYTPKEIINKWRVDPDYFTDDLNEEEIELYGTIINRLEDFGEEYAELYNNDLL